MIQDLTSTWLRFRRAQYGYVAVRCFPGCRKEPMAIDAKNGWH